MNFTYGLRRANQTKPLEKAILRRSGDLTWAQLTDTVSRVAGALRACGLRNGDTVAILAHNCEAYLELYLSVPWAGGVLVPLNYRWTVIENAFALRDSDAKLLIVDDEHLEAGTKLAAEIAGLTLIHLGDQPTTDRAISYRQIVSSGPPVDDAMRGSNDLAFIFYTGGTTGRSKGVMLSHGNVTASALHALAAGIITADTVYLSAAPMFHLGNGTTMFPTLLTGGQNAILPSFNARGFAESVERHRITHTLLVPTMVQTIVDDPCIGEFDLSSLRQIAYGAAPISEALIERAMHRLPHTEFVQLYGMTELSPIATVLPFEQHLGAPKARGRLRSAGRAIIGVEVRIVGPDDQEMPRGQIGEITVRGDTVMMGYRNLPDQTAAAVRNGWMHTGDAGYMDEEGYVYVVDRIKDMIISGGENVYSTEVENVLAQHPHVQACAVIGVPDDRWGEAVHAAVVLRDGQETPPPALIEFCRRFIAAYKSPRSVEIRSALPVTAAGKVDKPALRREFMASQ